MASLAPTNEDPLIEALPPATDYMTYLTMLEYQLTPQNLPTLCRLLSEDDGKLAEEIGWDLLKLVLPMLKDTPDEVNRCLEIVARRGNPREVVVRVAEELEKLGDDVDTIDGDDDDDDNDDVHGQGDDAAAAELPTFPGEAPRVHLGPMTLSGMPDAPKDTPIQGDETQSEPIKSLKLQTLFNMLGILHPRIKTQYPSRFLATSLPAALGAYRQLPISTANTSAFLGVLEKLTGKKRPALPPRVSSAQVLSSAPLPDPEAQAEQEVTGSKAPSEEEKAIVYRLLDAVILEVLDEYLSSLASDEFASMSWTARLRESLEPKRVVPGRPTETDEWKDTPKLKERDVLIARFHTLCKEVNLDPAVEIKRIVHDDEVEEPYQEEEEEQEASEYPTSPAQIPFPRAGVIFLEAYESFISSQDTTSHLTTTELTKLIAHSFPLSATPSIPSPALQDALLSLLYKQTIPTSPQGAREQPSPAKFLLLISTLTQLFTITPWPALRDAAHYICGKLLHAYPDAEVRTRIITQTLQGSTLSTNWAEIEEEPDPKPGIDEETGLARSTSALQPHPIPLAPPQQMGALKAVGVDWLKDEFAVWIQSEKQPPNSGGAGGLDPSVILTTVETEPDVKNQGSEPSSSPFDLLFPQDLPALPATTTTTARDDEDDDQDDLTTFLLSIPFFISTLNLTCVTLPHIDLSSTSTSTGASGIGPRIHKHISSLTASSKFLLDLLQHASSSASASNTNTNAGALEDSRADIFALEDACARAAEVAAKAGLEA